MLAAATAMIAVVEAREPNAELAGTSWRLVGFQGADDSAVKPDVPAKYTLAFGSDGTANVRFDCNRGRVTWTSTGPGRLQFGTMTLTQATCRRGSLHGRLVEQWPLIHSYVRRDGHLFLSLMADGGILEFEPDTVGVITGIATFRERMTLPPEAVFEALLEDVSRADAPADVVGRAQMASPGNLPIRFEIPYDRARILANRRYNVRARIVVGDRLLFTTDTAVPVLVDGQAAPLSLMLRRVGSGG
jgi:uncharacterized lipoprotein YbaY